MNFLKKNYLKIISLIFALVIIFWLAVFLLVNDFSVPTRSVDRYKKILVVYPHPDDEILTAGGVMSVNKHATLLILTMGERGGGDGSVDLDLKEIRTREEEISAKIFNVENLIHKDLGDGDLINKPDQVRREIADVLSSEEPDLVITFDLSGLYGHPDHTIVAEEVTELIKTEFQDIELWYATYPKRVFQFLNLPEHMALDPVYKDKRTFPTHKVFVGLNVLSKIRANRAHASQYQPFLEGFPLAIPVEFFQSMMVFEYFYKAN